MQFTIFYPNYWAKIKNQLHVTPCTYKHNIQPWKLKYTKANVENMRDKICLALNFESEKRYFYWVL